MAETTADVRRDIELTRDRMSSTLAELEQAVSERADYLPLAAQLHLLLRR